LTYNHQPHVDLGCDYCHTGVKTRARASFPDITVCVDCHEKPPVKAPAEIAVWNQAVKTKHIVWRQLTWVRSHVYFSHQRHVELAKLECVTCHGDMAKRSSPPPHALKPISMDVCVDCHRQKQVSTDCARCHK
jgi:predicted CXXCH cytochrome family protein